MKLIQLYSLTLPHTFLHLPQYQVYDNVNDADTCKMIPRNATSDCPVDVFKRVENSSFGKKITKPH